MMFQEFQEFHFPIKHHATSNYNPLIIASYANKHLGASANPKTRQGFHGLVLSNSPLGLAITAQHMITFRASSNFGIVEFFWFDFAALRLISVEYLDL
jgi:hypothetical protein